jgi:2-desacetyl-2-hydroxyethyl bacteriochlorophyllide A dehydrogenase
MRALVYTAPGKVAIEDQPRPSTRSNETEIAIEVAGICGSDISGFLGHSALRRPPLILGHELVGRRPDGQRVIANPLISCGQCESCTSGAQNLCWSWKLLGLGPTPGSFAEYVTLPDAQVYPIPDTLSSDDAILTEPLANIVHLFRLVAPAPLFRLAIVGAGTMGALALSLGRIIGASEVMAVDINDPRLETMRQLGATAAINISSPDGLAESLRLAGSGFDVVMDASGSAAARQTAFNLCRAGGKVALLGMASQTSEVNFVASIRKEHRVVMSFAYTPSDFQSSLSLLIAEKINLKNWTRRMPLENGQQAFEQMSYNPGKALKMLLEVSAS